MATAAEKEEEEEEVSERAGDPFAKRGALSPIGSLEPRAEPVSRPLFRALPRSSKGCPSALVSARSGPLLTLKQQSQLAQGI